MTQEEEETPQATKTARVDLPLEWTQLGQGNHNEDNHHPPIRYPEEVTDLNREDDEVIVVGTAGKKITNMGPEFHTRVNPNLSQLILRSHVIRKMEGLQGLRKLELLELYDNQVEALSCLDEGEDGAPGATLKTLDMSYNVIRDMTPVQVCPHLVDLYLANNKLKRIAGLKGLHHLRKLDLGANRIRVMDADELSGLVNLEELWLGKNKIEKIEGLEQLTKLRRLDVQSNRLTCVENLQSQQDTLEELYLAHNAIDNEGTSQPTGLALSFPHLSVLDLNRNKLTSTDPLVHLKSLDELWISGNLIASMDDVQSLSELDSLSTIYLEYNDCQKDPLYRKKLQEIMPNLKQIDADLIGGLAAHGIPSVRVGTGQAAWTEEERLHKLQEQIIERARAETEGGLKKG